MKRILIWAGSIVLFAVVAIAGLIILLPFFIDPNDYKGQLEDFVYRKSGYTLHIPGKIDLKITPGLDVLFSLGRVRISAGPAFPDMVLLSSEEARVELSLIPFLRDKSLAVQGITLRGVYCNLLKNKDGVANWEITRRTPPDNPAAKKTEVLPSAPPPSSVSTTPSFDLGALDLTDISLRYEDQQTGKTIELKNFSFNTGRVQDGMPFHLQSGFTLVSSGNSNAAISLQGKFTSDVTLDLSAKSIRMDAAALTSSVKVPGIRETDIRLIFDALVDVGNKAVSIKNSSLVSGLLTVNFEASVNDYSNPEFQGTLDIPVFNLRRLLTDNNLPQPRWQNVSALTDIGLSCTFSGDHKKLRIYEIMALLDGSTVRGSFTMLNSAHPFYDLVMHADTLNLDLYGVAAPSVTPAASGDRPGAAPAGVVPKSKETMEAIAAAQPLIPVDTMKKLNFKMDLTVDSMQIKNAQLSDAGIKAEGKNGFLQLEKLKANLYGGTLTAMAAVDVRGDVPTIKASKKLAKVQIGPLLKDVTGKEDVTGTAEMELDIESRGNLKKQLIRNSNGTFTISFVDGVIRKLHILQVIRQAKALYEGGKVVSAAIAEPTGFANINATGVIRDGVLINKDLTARSDLMKVNGSGKVDFGDEYVDYLLQVSLLRALDRDEKSGLAEFSRYIIPYRIKGDFDEIKQDANLSDLLKSQAKDLLINEVQKHLKGKSGKEKTGKEGGGDTQKLLEHGLKSLFGS